MRRLQVRFIGFLIGVHFNQTYLGWLIFDGDRIKHQHARLDANGSLDLLSQRGLVGLELGWVDLQLCKTYKRL